ncbi:MAG TPA: Hsp20/alpha crystallin family protein [Candidatus Binatia bacterium]|nr:Hsp20/alpha crystallin family protein [Candidatus Binatia bacterium]
MALGNLTTWRQSAVERRSDSLASLREEMGELFERLFAGRERAGSPGGFQPDLDVTEDETAIRVTAEIPGMKESDVEVSLCGDCLTIAGEKRSESERRVENAHVVERTFGRFERSVRLPVPVKDDDVQATYRNGVLSIVLPKAAAGPRKRQISVSAGEAPPSAAGEAAATGSSGGQPPQRADVNSGLPTTETTGGVVAGVAAGAPRRVVAREESSPEPSAAARRR